MKAGIYTRAIFKAMVVMVTVIAGLASAQQKKPSGPTHETSMDNEAKVFIQRFWEKVLRRCPDPPRADSYFSYTLSASLHFIGHKLYYTTEGYGNDHDAPLDGYCCQSMTEFKGLSFHTLATPLSEADRLNGVTWAGLSSIGVQAHRQREQGGARGWGSWNEWKSRDTIYGAVTQIYFRKIHGAWDLDRGRNAPAIEALAGMPGCSDLDAPISEMLWHNTHTAKLSQLFVVDDPDGLPYIPIRDPVLVNRIIAGADPADAPFQIATTERLPKNTNVRAVLNDDGTLTETKVRGGDDVYRGIMISVPQTGIWAAIEVNDYSALQPRATILNKQVSDVVSLFDIHHMLVVSGEGVRFSSVSIPPRAHLKQFRFALDEGTLPLGTVLTPQMDVGAGGDILRVGTLIEGAGNSYLFRAINKATGLGRDVLIPVADLKYTTNAPKQ